MRIYVNTSLISYRNIDSQRRITNLCSTLFIGFDIINKPTNINNSDILDNSKNLKKQHHELHPFSNTSLKIEEKQKKRLKNAKFQNIYDLINDYPISINTIFKKTSMPISEISNALFMLELDSYIKKVAGGYICTYDN